MEKEFNAQQSLQIIEGMINKAQNRFAENGFLYLLWGWVVLACAIVQFFFYRYKIIEKPEMIWMITWVVAIYQIFYIIKKEKNVKVKTYTDEIIGFVWMVFGFTMFIVGFVLGKNNHWESIYPMIIGLYGMPTFLSGAIMRFKPLKIGAIFCWVLSIISVYVNYDYLLLLLSLAVICAWIIPGYLMKIKYKKEQSLIRLN